MNKGTENYIPEDIAQIPLFATLPGEEIQNLFRCLSIRNLAPGEILFREGDIGDRFSIILEGSIEVVKSLDTLGERIFAVLGRGDFIGEMSLLYRDRLRSASARARTSTRLLEITESDFHALLKRQPDLAFRIMQEISLRLRNAENDTVRDLLEKNQQLAQAYQELKAAQSQLIEKEKMEHELRMARRIQEGILPKEIPVFPGWKLAALWQPARVVSGDFYDFITFADGKIGLIIGDVSGKGVPAALVMATTRSILRAAASQNQSPGKVLAHVNNLLCPDMAAGMFVTCLFVVLDPESGSLQVANAGHPYPFLKRLGEISELHAKGMPLGLMSEMDYIELETTIERDDELLMFSDGMIEGHDEAGNMFSSHRLADLFLNHPDSETLISFLLEQLAEFSGDDWEQEDDVTLVYLKRDGNLQL